MQKSGSRTKDKKIVAAVLRKSPCLEVSQMLLKAVVIIAAIAVLAIAAAVVGMAATTAAIKQFYREWW